MMSVTGWLLLVLGGVCQALSVGRWARTLAPWVAPGLLLVATAHWPSTYALAVVWITLTLAAVPGGWGVVPLSPAWQWLFCAATALLPGLLPYAAHRWLVPQLPEGVATLVFPASAVVGEFLSMRLSPFGSWGSVAYTQHRARSLSQWVSVTGLWGITFLVSWTAPILAQLASSPRHALAPLMCWAAVLMVVVLWGRRRLMRAEAGAVHVPVAAITWSDALMTREQLMAALMPSSAEQRVAQRGQFQRVLDGFRDATRQAAAAGSALVLWPEACVPMWAEDEEAVLAQLARTAQDSGVWLAAGIAVLHAREGAALRLDNAVVLYDTSGTLRWRYRKARPVPGWERACSLPSVDRLPVSASDWGPISGAICFDLDFPALIRQAGRASCVLLLVPASDWREIGTLHQVQAMFRAIENGTSLLRATRWGTSAACTSTGACAATLDAFSTQERVLRTDLAVKSVPTLYRRWGDAVAWSAVVLLIGLALWALV
jgi:apolipoprotein N-acyltransferase